MFPIVPYLKDNPTFSEYFEIASKNWGEFTFDASILKFILYLVFGIAILLFLREVISRIRDHLENKKRVASGELDESIASEAAVKSGQKREDVRFTLPEYPIRVYLLSDKIDIPVACNCIDFSAGGVLVELEEPEVGCLEYLFKKERIVIERHLSIAKAKKLSFYQILPASPLDDKSFARIEKQMKYMTEWDDRILKAVNFISSLSKDDILEIFFVLPPLPWTDGVNKKLLLEKTRTIQNKVAVTLLRKSDSFAKSKIGLSFLNLGYMRKDNIYLYGLETWRARKKEPQVENA